MEYELSAHALSRFHERVHPTLTPAAAADLCQQLVGEHGWYQADPPDWVHQSEVVNHSNTGWVCLNDDIVFPVSAGGVLATCITRACLAAPIRDSRNRRNAKKRYRKHGPKLGRGGRSNRRPVADAA